MAFQGPLVVDIERKLRTYVVIWRAARALVEEGGDLEAQDRSMAAGVLAAFSFEAYLNHVGAALLDNWDEVEKRLGWRPKLLLIGELLSLPINQGAAPFQALPSLFRFRDDLAHGKTRSARLKDQPLPPEPLDSGLLEMIDEATLPWERQCEPTNIAAWMEAVKAMVIALHEAYLKHPRVLPLEKSDPFATKSHGMATVKVTQSE